MRNINVSNSVCDWAYTYMGKPAPALFRILNMPKMSKVNDPDNKGPECDREGKI